MKQFIKHGREHGCLPDFINLHFYPMISTVMNEPVEDSMKVIANAQQPMRLFKEANVLHKSLDWLHLTLKEEGMPQLPCYISEWNSTPHHRDLLNDTCFKAAYIVKSIVENQHKVKSFAYWLASDLHEEFRFSNDEFHGGLGLFTYQKIPKAAYYAFVFLNQLGSEIIAQGEGYILTRKEEKMVALFYHYVHFSDLYASGEHFNLDRVKRDAPFQSNEKKQFSLQLQGLEKGNYLLTEKAIHPKSGSAFDAWVEMGAQPLTTLEEVAFLKAQSLPKIVKSRRDVTDGLLELRVVLAPHEVRLVEFAVD